MWITLDYYVSEMFMDEWEMRLVPFLQKETVQFFRLSPDPGLDQDLA